GIRLLGRPTISCEEDVPRIVHEARHDIYAMSTLRQSKRPRVDHTIGPFVAQVFERGDDDVERVSFVELQHEWDVLENDPWNPPPPQKTKDLAYETRPRAR